MPQRAEHAYGLALPCRSLWFIDFTGSLKLSPSAKAKAHQKRESMADEDNKKAQQVHRSPLCSSRTRLSRGTERLIAAVLILQEAAKQKRLEKEAEQRRVLSPEARVALPVTVWISPRVGLVHD